MNPPTAKSSRTDHFTDEARWQEEAGYSRAVRRGCLIAVSGTTASAPDGDAEELPSAQSLGDTEAQTVDAIARCLRAVEALGGTVEDVVRTRVYLAPEADWRGAARAHRHAFSAVAPANTMLHVAGMIGEGLLVEVEVDAFVLDALPQGEARA